VMEKSGVGKHLTCQLPLMQIELLVLSSHWVKPQ